MEFPLWKTLSRDAKVTGSFPSSTFRCRYSFVHCQMWAGRGQRKFGVHDVCSVCFVVILFVQMCHQFCQGVNRCVMLDVPEGGSRRREDNKIMS